MSGEDNALVRLWRRATSRPTRRPAPQTSLVVLAVAAFFGWSGYQAMLRGESAALQLLVCVVLVGFAFRNLYFFWIYRNLSNEEIAVRAREASGAPADAPLPTVPPWPHQPGRFLPYCVTPTRWSQFPGVLLVAALVLNGFVQPLFVVALGSWSAGSFFGVGIVGLFSLLGLLLAVHALKELMVWLRIHPPSLELDRLPLPMGGEVMMRFAQAGPLTLDRLTLKLVCEESAQYTVGTDTRTEKRVVYEQVVLADSAIVIERRHPYTRELRVRIPDGAMHSFVGSHNEVRWRLQISGDVPRFPDFDRAIELIVAPATANEAQPYR